jgi:hypothetical protein
MTKSPRATKAGDLGAGAEAGRGDAVDRAPTTLLPASVGKGAQGAQVTQTMQTIPKWRGEVGCGRSSGE